MGFAGATFGFVLVLRVLLVFVVVSLLATWLVLRGVQDELGD